MAEDMTIVQPLMAPSTAVCDRLGLKDEHERGMMRMLVNMMIFSAVALPTFYLVWEAFG